MKGVEIVRPCDRHSNETVTLGKHVTKYKNMRNGWTNFSEDKFENRGIKIASVNANIITKSINLLIFCLVLRVLVMFTFLN